MEALLDVLIVDDDLNTCEILQTGLEIYCDCTIGAAMTCEEALAISRRPIVVLLDYYIHDSDPDALIRSIRERLPGCNIVLASGVEGIAAKAKALGLKHSLPKPYDIAAAAKLIKSLLPTKQRT